MDVRTLCLGVLSLEDASGYEIKKTLENRFKHFYDASFGSIYPALNRLQTEGLVACNHEVQDKRPDKKVYSLTGQGRLALVRELMSQPTDDRIRSEFMVMMMFADLLSVSHVSALIDQRIAWHRKAIAKLESEEGRHESSGQRFVIGYGLSVYRAVLEYLEENRHLVESESLLAQVADGSTPDRHDPAPAGPAD